MDIIEEQIPQSDGIVYVFSNPAMPGIVKIGMTTRDSVDDRLRELSVPSGVPVPFECDYACRVVRCGDIEAALHTAFNPYRINPRREFFKIEADQAIAFLRVLAIEEVTSEVSEEAERIMDPVEVSSGKRLKRSRRPPLGFHEMGISNGEVLNWHEGGDRIVIVSGNRLVSYKGTEMSLTRVTTDLLGNPYDVQPTPYWTYNGRNLREIYNETYPRESE